MVAALVTALAAGAAGAETAPIGRTLVVGTFEDPPFSVQDETGQWSGLAIDLWREVAKEMGVPFEIRGIEPASALFEAVEQGQVDVMAAAVPVTADRLTRVEFSTTFLSKVYAIATTPVEARGVLEELLQLFSRRLLLTMGAIALLFLVSSFGMWWLERNRNPDHFGGHPVRGLGEALWWTAATVTTVGYGDRTPVTAIGRLFAIGVMFASIVLVSLFTGVVASQLTVSQLHGRVHGIADLARARVGILQGSPMDEFLSLRGIPHISYPDIAQALTALSAGELDAVVSGEPELHYYAERSFTGRVVIVPGAIDQGFLAFALPTGSPLRLPLDRALVHVLESPSWPPLRRQYLSR